MSEKAVKPKMVRVIFMLTPQLVEQLRRESRETGLSMSDLVRRALGEYLEK